MSFAKNYITAAIENVKKTYHPCCATVRRICPETGRVLSEEKYDFSQQHVRLKSGKRPNDIPEQTARQKIKAVEETINGLKRTSDRGPSRLAILPWDVLKIGRTSYFRKHKGSLTVLKEILVKADKANIIIDQNQLALKSIEISHMFAGGLPEDPFPMLPPEVIAATQQAAELRA
jgi:hypothetical protein